MERRQLAIALQPLQRDFRLADVAVGRRAQRPDEGEVRIEPQRAVEIVHARSSNFLLRERADMRVDPERLGIVRIELDRAQRIAPASSRACRRHCPASPGRHRTAASRRPRRAPSRCRARSPAPARCSGRPPRISRAPCCRSAACARSSRPVAPIFSLRFGWPSMNRMTGSICADDARDHFLVDAVQLALAELEAVAPHRRRVVREVEQAHADLVFVAVARDARRRSRNRARSAAARPR